MFIRRVTFSRRGSENFLEYCSISDNSGCFSVVLALLVVRAFLFRWKIAVLHWKIEEISLLIVIVRTSISQVENGGERARKFSLNERASNGKFGQQ